MILYFMHMLRMHRIPYYLGKRFRQCSITQKNMDEWMDFDFADLNGFQN